MTVSASDFSIASLTLPHEDPAAHRRLYDQWLAAYPCPDPIERGYIDQAVTALINRRRIEQSLHTLRTERVRTAELRFDRAQEDHVARCKEIFSQRCEWAMREMTRTSAGCLWCIKFWEQLDEHLKRDGTWYGSNKYLAIVLQGLSARFEELCVSEVAYTTWVDCLVCQPNPKQRDIDRILDPTIIPKGIQDRDVTVWPGNPAESRARLRAIVDRELPRLRALEAMLRVQYEVPARAEARQMALARVSKDEAALLRAGRAYEQSYQAAATALLRARKQNAASRPPAAVTGARASELDEVAPALHPVARAAGAPVPAAAAARPVVGRSEHRCCIRPIGRSRWSKPNSIGFCSPRHPGDSPGANS